MRYSILLLLLSKSTKQGEHGFSIETNKQTHKHIDTYFSLTSSNKPLILDSLTQFVFTSSGLSNLQKMD
jgi:hypothetical protein